MVSNIKDSPLESCHCYNQISLDDFGIRKAVLCTKAAAGPWSPMFI